jgi:hypothetical protein
MQRDRIGGWLVVLAMALLGVALPVGMLVWVVGR